MNPLSEQEYNRIINRLKADGKATLCKEYIRDCSEFLRENLYTSLIHERTLRKCAVIKDIFKRSGENWGQTIYTLFLRTLGDATNSKAFETLATRVTYNSVMRERHSRVSVEALMLGTSGLLSLYPQDNYTRQLMEEYAHLAWKYAIEQMTPSEWNLRNIRPYNHPVLRIVQAANLLASHNFFANEVLSCNSCADIESLFNAEVSEYWLTHFTPGRSGKEVTKSIGTMKCHLLGINMVAPAKYLYGNTMGRDNYNTEALAILDSIPAEQNRYIASWEEYGVIPSNAFASQALLQLSTEHCARNKCEECQVARFMLNDAAFIRGKEF